MILYTIINDIIYNCKRYHVWLWMILYTIVNDIMYDYEWYYIQL